MFLGSSYKEFPKLWLISRPWAVVDLDVRCWRRWVARRSALVCVVNKWAVSVGWPLMPVWQPPWGLITPRQISISDNISRINLHKCDAMAARRTAEHSVQLIGRLSKRDITRSFFFTTLHPSHANLVPCSFCSCQPPPQCCETNWQHNPAPNVRSYGAPSN